VIFTLLLSTAGEKGSNAQSSTSNSAKYTGGVHNPMICHAWTGTIWSNTTNVLQTADAIK